MKAVINITYYGLCDKFRVDIYDITLELKNTYRAVARNYDIETTVYKSHIGNIQYCYMNYADNNLWINGNCSEEDIENWKIKLRTEYLKNRKIGRK